MNPTKNAMSWEELAIYAADPIDQINGLNIHMPHFVFLIKVNPRQLLLFTEIIMLGVLIVKKFGFGWSLKKFLTGLKKSQCVAMETRKDGIYKKCPQECFLQ